MKNAFKKFALAATLAASFVVPSVSNAAAVQVFYNGAYVEPGDEAGGLVNTLNGQGHMVGTFTGVTAADWTAAFAGGSAVVIPETGVAGNLAPDLDAAAQAAILAGVQGGKTLVVTEGENDSASFLNSIFGWSLVTNYGGGVWTQNAANAAGTPFAGGPLQLENNNSVYGHDLTSLPVGVLDLYSNGSSSAAWMITVGAGHVVFLGWDWFDAAAQDGGWLSAMNSAVNVGASSQVPEPGSLLLVGVALAGLGLSRRRKNA